MTLRQALSIRPENHRQVREGGNRHAESLVDEDLLGRIGEVIVAADNVRDRHGCIIDGNGEVISGSAIGSDQNEVVDSIDRECHITAYSVRENDIATAIGHLQAPHVRLTCQDARGGGLGIERAACTVVSRKPTLGTTGLTLGVQFGRRTEARIRPTGRLETLERLRITPGALGLEVWAVIATDTGAFIVIEAEPLHGTKNRLGVLLGRAFRVCVLDAKDECAAVAAGKGPVIDRGTGAADVQMTCRAWREPYAYVLGHGTPFGSISQSTRGTRLRRLLRGGGDTR